MKNQDFKVWISSLCIAFLCFACFEGSSKKSAQNKSKEKHQEHEPEMSNRIDLPANSRKNLGIRFAQVERRQITDVLRLPGYFELRPDARRAYLAPLEGEVKFIAEEYQDVEVGDLLFEVSSPQWFILRQELLQAQAEIQEQNLERLEVKAEQEENALLADALQEKRQGLKERLSFHAEHVEALGKEEGLWLERVQELEKLQKAGGGRASELSQAKIALAQTRSALVESEEKASELRLQKVELQAQLKIFESKDTSNQKRLQELEEILTTKRDAFNALQVALALKLGVEVEEVQKDLLEVEQEDRRNSKSLKVYAQEKGRVLAWKVEPGAWVNSQQEVLETLDESKLRFRATAFQGDLGKLRKGLPAEILAPQGIEREEDGQPNMQGEIAFGFEADSFKRNLDIIIVPESLRAWVKPGVAAYLEIFLARHSRPELAIPLDCIIQDGLEQVYFLRDRDDPNQVIRVEADLGLRDERWVEIRSGLREGDQVVLDGVYELKVSKSGKALEGGHFHADGTWHADDDH